MDEAVLALEGAVAPMSCFVDDSAATRTGRARARTTSDHGHGCATKLLWTRVQGGVVEALRAHDARRARRLLLPRTPATDPSR